MPFENENNSEIGKQRAAKKIRRVGTYGKVIAVGQAIRNNCFWTMFCSVLALQIRTPVLTEL